MRAVILGLILANILYWTWASQIDQDVRPVVRALDPDLPRLQLVPRENVTDESPLALAAAESSGADGEEKAVEVARIGADDVLSVDEQAQQASDTDDAVTTDVRATPAEGSSGATVTAQNVLANVSSSEFPKRCVGVGPFVSLREASEAAALINQAGPQTAQRVEEAQVWVGHWVHLPSYPSRADAVKVVELLREKGIKDIYIEPSGELKNTISLGLFSELARAEIRAGNVRKLSELSPQIRNRSRDGLVYWIDVALDAGVSIEVEKLPHSAPEKLRLDPVECPPATANG